MISLRRLNKNDLREFDEIFTETIQKEFSEYSKKTLDYFTDTKYKRKMFNCEIRIGAFINDKLVGFLLAQDPVGGVLQVFWIAVIKPYQKRGIGSKLLGYLEKMALKKGVHNLQLQSDARNIPFYKKTGYQILGYDLKGYFGTDNYLMKKLIQEPKEENFLK